MGMAVTLKLLVNLMNTVIRGHLTSFDEHTLKFAPLRQTPFAPDIAGCCAVLQVL